MKRITQYLIISLFALLIIGCQPETVVETVIQEVEVTRVVTETVFEEGETVEVTRVVTSVEEVETTTESTADEAIAAAPQNQQPIIIATPAPQATQAITPRDMFFQDYGVNPYILTSEDNLSTFSLDVDTGSYSIARRYINDGLPVPPEAVRVEEFVNAFPQGYALPPNTAFAIYADGAPSPFHSDGTYFLRIGVQGYDVAEEDRAAAALTFVIDVSGSMAQENRLGLVKESLELLVDRMRPDDTIAVVVYGSDARVVLNPTPGSERSTILSAIYGLSTEGSTNLEAGLRLGYQLANRAYKPGGINRVIIASDGVANVGNTDPDVLAQEIRGYADAGITLTTVGFGLGNYNDIIMEQLADQGDGNYAYVDTLDEAETLFVDNMMSTLQVIALDAKIQVEFDPQVVQQYRLVGYENRAIADQDFRNNEVDAAEFGAGHNATAIYAVQLVPGANGERGPSRRIATVNLRWQDPDTRQVTEISGDFFTDNLAASFDAAPLYYQLAVVVSQYAELLRDSYWAEGVTLNDLRIRSERLAGQMELADVVEFANLVASTR
ncbi:MAG: von Willebrand factor type A domain-containing protein [Ardenticatenaceae bacterium]|nr:von Willebrand factor type A domain-containing protein [Ardenticatenaceae bacterium]